VQQSTSLIVHMSQSFVPKVHSLEICKGGKGKSRCRRRYGSESWEAAWTRQMRALFFPLRRQKKVCPPTNNARPASVSSKSIQQNFSLI